MSSTDLTCQFCRKDYSSKAKLLYHQKTTRKCLKIQEEQGLVINRSNFSCENCEKTFTSNHRLRYHLDNSCKNKQNNNEKIEQMEQK